jgi:hypothetical protein
MGDKNRGLYQKYIVERVDGKPVDYCIVLELKDQNTWPAMLKFAETTRAAGYEALADDIEKMVSYARARQIIDDNCKGW